MTLDQYNQNTNGGNPALQTTNRTQGFGSQVRDAFSSGSNTGTGVDKWYNRINSLLHPSLSTNVETDVNIKPVQIIVALGAVALICKLLFFPKK